MFYLEHPSLTPSSLKHHYTPLFVTMMTFYLPYWLFSFLITMVTICIWYIDNSHLFWQTVFFCLGGYSAGLKLIIRIMYSIAASMALDKSSHNDILFSHSVYGGTVMIASCSTFRPHPGWVIRDLFSSLLVSGYNLRADCQWRTLVSPLNSGVNAVPASVYALV